MANIIAEQEAHCMEMRYVFECLCEITRVGETVCVVGANNELGNWNPYHAVELTTSEDRFPLWYSRPLALPDLPSEFKFIIKKRNGDLRWENCENRVLLPAGQCGNILIRCRFGIRDMGVSADSVFATETELSGDCVSNDTDPPVTRATFYSEHALSRAATFVEQLSGRPSYRQKLRYINEQIHVSPDQEILSLATVLLKMIQSNYIVCQEDGRHFRPCVHATTSREIATSLFNLMESYEVPHIFLSRMIIPLLPSFTGEYTKQEPLTRIRDIAHRSDIPQHLKNRIKTQLQNKLHRCCDPSDLDTCYRILQEIRHLLGPGSVLNDFEIFYEELAAFFSASGLSILLRKNRDVIDSNLQQELLKPRKNDVVDLRRTLRAIENSRMAIVKSLWDKETSILRRSQLLILDVELEREAFISLSALESLSDDMNALISGMIFSMKQLSLSIPHNAEIKSLLQYMSGLVVPSNAHEWRVLHSVIHRMINWHHSEVSNVYLTISDAAVALMPLVSKNHDSAAQLGEGIIRSQIIFQLLKFIEKINIDVKKELKIPPLDIISAGATPPAILVHVDSLPPKKFGKVPQLGDEPCNVIFLVENVSGNEQVSSLEDSLINIFPKNSRVVGIILRTPIPCLSHLGVRTRQERLVCVSVDPADTEIIKAALRMEGPVVLNTHNPVQIIQSTQISGSFESAPPKKSKDENTLIPVSNPSHWKIEKGSSIKRETCGGKSYNCSKVSSILTTAFSAPDCVALPFSTLPKLLAANPEIHSEFLSVVQAVKESESSIRTATLSERIQELVKSLQLPMSIQDLIHKSVEDFPNILMVRSSADVEDNKNDASAGKFLSVSTKKENLIEAILSVLASLYSTESVMSMKNIDQVHMAVLLQPMVRDFEFSGIIHTVAPDRSDDSYVEIAQGHGEVLTSGSFNGRPHRLRMSKDGTSEFLSYSNLNMRGEICEETGVIRWIPTKMQDDPIIQSESVRNVIKERLLQAIGQLVGVFGSRLDIEITIAADGSITVVQVRDIV